MAFFVKDGLILTDRLEVQIVDHCNFSCRSCNHLSPAFPARFESVSNVEYWLSLLQGKMRAHLVYAIGGEPTLHPHFLEMLKVLKGSQVSAGVAVITNGSHLEKFTDEALSFLDRIEVSVYQGKEPTLEKLADLETRCVKFGVQLLVQRVGSFRESYAARVSEDATLANRVFRACNIAHVWGILFLANGAIYKCARSHFIGIRFPRAQTSRAESVILNSRPELFSELKDYLFDLNTTESLAGCQNCLGTVGKRIVHEQVERKKWEDLQNFELESLLDFETLNRVERDGFSIQNEIYEQETILASTNLVEWDSFPYLYQLHQKGLVPRLHQIRYQLAEGGIELKI